MRTKPDEAHPSRAGTRAPHREEPRGRQETRRRRRRRRRRSISAPGGKSPFAVPERRTRLPRRTRPAGPAGLPGLESVDAPASPRTSRRRRLGASPSSGRRRSAADSTRRARGSRTKARPPPRVESRRTTGGPCRTDRVARHRACVSGPSRSETCSFPKTRSGSARPRARTPARAPRRTASKYRPTRRFRSSTPKSSPSPPKSFARRAAENEPPVRGSRRSPGHRI